jgi:biopolymer transport protein ExbD
MRSFRSRLDDSTFALNLAPMLDIIVSITPMLLLSVVFIKVNVIDSPLPQAVEQAIQQQKDQKDVSVQLKVNKDKGFEFTVNDGGQKSQSGVALKNGAWDMDGLKNEAMQIKQKHPAIFRLDLVPDKRVSLNEIVMIMDQVRKEAPTAKKFTFQDPKTGQAVETDLMFPSVIFANVMGD